MTDTEWLVTPHRNRHHVEIYRAVRFTDPTGANGGRLINEWRWRRRAGNGRIISASTEGFTTRRKLVANLEAVTNMTLLDQDRQLVGPRWYLYGVRLAYADHAPEDGQVQQKAVQTSKIPVRTPDTRWTSRISSRQGT